MAQSRKETTFAKAIRRYMEIHGMTQEDFANVVETSKSNVSKWLNGQGQRQDTVDYVAERLGMAPWQLLMYAEDEHSYILPPHVQIVAHRIARLPTDKQRAFLTFLEAWDPIDAMNAAAV